MLERLLVQLKEVPKVGVFVHQKWDFLFTSEVARLAHCSCWCVTTLDRGKAPLPPERGNGNPAAARL